MSESKVQPNILFLMTDQWRHDFLGCAGASFVRTPNIDSVAARGVRFTQCCTNSPVCAPARIGLAAGLQPIRMGSLDNLSYLPVSTPTYYQRLRDSGYHVACVGKLDLAKPARYNGRSGDRPCNFGWGFTHPLECEGKMHAGTSPTPLGPYTHYLKDRGLLQQFHEDYKARRAKGWVIGASHDSALPGEAYEDAYVGRRAAAWIESVPADFPWHYFVSFVGPHDPFDPPAEYADRYRDAAMPEAVTDRMADKPERVRRRALPAESEDILKARRQYCATIELIDDHIGRILDALERRGMMDNTCIVYSSDHGEMLGDHGLFHKSVMYDPALRVPLIVAGPGIEGGRVSDALVELIDVNPTLCELGGLPQQERIDARPLGPVLRGEASAHRTEAVSALRTCRCIRTMRHKLIENYNDVLELYDLAEDPDELRNVAAAQPGLAQELRGRMSARFIEGRWQR